MTEEQVVEYFKEHYANTSNADLAKHFGKSVTYIGRIALKYNFKKSEEYRLWVQNKASQQAAKKVHGAGEPLKTADVPLAEVYVALGMPSKFIPCTKPSRKIVKGIW